MNKEDRYIKTINDALEQEEYYFLDSVFAEYSLLAPDKAVTLLNRSFQSDLFKKDIITLSHNFINYWKQLNNYFNDFSKSNQDLILSEIKSIKTWNRIIEVEIIEICKKAATTLTDEKRIAFYEEHLQFILNKDFLMQELEDPDLYCLWFICQLKKDKSVYVNQITVEIFDFSNELFSKLLNELDRMQAREIYHDFNFLMKFTPVNLLYFALKNIKIKYEGHQNLPEIFYNNKLIQRVFINIDLELDLPKDILEKVIASIDYNFKFYGIEMNNFVQKHQIDDTNSENFFVDGIGPVVVSSVQHLPYIPVSVLKSPEQVDVLINLLSDTTNRDAEHANISQFKEISKEGQIKEILRILNTTDNWNTYENNTQLFLHKLIDGEDLRNSYKEVIIEMVDYSLINHFSDDRNAIKYLESQNYLNTHEFSYLDSKLLTSMVDYAGENNAHLIYSVLFNDIKPKNLSTLSVFLNSEKENLWVDLNDFINTSLGRYYSVVEKVPNNIITEYYLSAFKNGIENCAPEYRDYLKGKFYKFFVSETEDLKSVNTFIGFSHNYRIGFHSKDNELFIEAAKQLFTSNISDNFIVDNLVSVLATKVDPYEEYFSGNLTNQTYKNRLFMSMLELYFSIDIISETYLLKWIQWYIEINNSIQTYVRHLIFYMADLPTSKISTLLNYLETYGQYGGDKVEDYEFSYIHSIDEFSKEKFKKFIQLIALLLQKNYVNINYPFVSGIDDILDKLSKKNYIDLITELIIIVKPFFLTSDIQTLEQKYLPKDSKK